MKKAMELFLVLLLLCLGAYGWWYAGTYYAANMNGEFSGEAEKVAWALQLLIEEMRTLVARL